MTGKGEDIDNLAGEIISKGSSPYLIPYGDSNIISALGYVEAVRELKEQLVYADLNMEKIFSR